jgi:hypothetical protein
VKFQKPWYARVSRPSVPGVDIGAGERVWPILVTANVTQSEPLYDLVERESFREIFTDSRVQSLLVLDAEDLEYLIGIVETGAYLPNILAQRQQSPWRRLEFARWANESPGSPGTDSRPSFATEKWKTVIDVLRQVLQVDDPVWGGIRIQSAGRQVTVFETSAFFLNQAAQGGHAQNMRQRVSNLSPLSRRRPGRANQMFGGIDGYARRSAIHLSEPFSLSQYASRAGMQSKIDPSPTSLSASSSFIVVPSYSESFEIT